VKRNRVSASRILAMGIALLILVSCRQAVPLGEPFVLREGDTVRVKGTELTVEVKELIEGLEGSQMIGDGSVTLRLVVEGEDETELYLEAGEWTRVSGYEVRFERVISDAEGARCELIVSQ
jgi:hypothetical protein